MQKSQEYKIGLTYRNQSNEINPLNRIKDKTHVIISTDAKMASDKIQYPYIIKILNKPGINVNFLNTIKATIKYLQPTSYLTLKGQKLPH